MRNLGSLVEQATQALDDYEYGRALDLVEREFWGFCDDYLEFVKGRRYGEQGPEAAGSANSALVAALSVYLRLLAPYLPFATEEAWSWWKSGSMHRAAWPSRRGCSRRRSSDVADADLAKWSYAREVLGAGAPAAVGGEAAAEGADREGRDRR